MPQSIDDIGCTPRDSNDNIATIIRLFTIPPNNEDDSNDERLFDTRINGNIGIGV
jgi:hypothetical protein